MLIIFFIIKSTVKTPIQQVKPEKRYFNLSELKEEGSENRTTSRQSSAEDAEDILSLEEELEPVAINIKCVYFIKT